MSRTYEKTGYLGSVTWEELCHIEETVTEKQRLWSSQSARKIHGTIIANSMLSQLKDQLEDIGKAKAQHELHPA